MHARLRGPNNLLILHQIIIELDFPSLVDEIAESRPDMNIKVVAFTVSEKSSNTRICLNLFKPNRISLYHQLYQFVSI